MRIREFSSGNDALDSVLNQATYFVVARFDKQQEILEKMHVLLRDGIESLAGPSARSTIDKRGFTALHEVLPAEKIGPLRDLVMPRVRADLLTLTSAVGRKLLGINGEFFIDDYTILRINYPFEVAVRASQTAENPGIGRVAPRTREESRTSKVIDPVYDPQSYHDHQPPPAWAHGPHRDTWTGHSRWGVNLWWALEDVSEECSMVFYPETFGSSLEPDPRSLYLKAGQPLPKPTMMALRRGEMLIFNPEMLHGTHLNTTTSTRLALSSRLNPQRPKFDPECFYAREFWHSSTNIEQGRFDDVIRFPRAENLETEASEKPPPHCRRELEVVGRVARLTECDWHAICPSARIQSNEKALVQVAGAATILLLRSGERLHATQAKCPHLDVSLGDGFHDGETLWCPAHAVAFCLSSGQSSCASLKLKVYEVREEGGYIWLRN